MNILFQDEGQNKGQNEGQVGSGQKFHIIVQDLDCRYKVKKELTKSVEQIAKEQIKKHFILNVVILHRIIKLVAKRTT